MLTTVCSTVLGGHECVYPHVHGPIRKKATLLSHVLLEIACSLRMLGTLGVNMDPTGLTVKRSQSSVLWMITLLTGHVQLETQRT